MVRRSRTWCSTTTCGGNGSSRQRGGLPRSESRATRAAGKPSGCRRSAASYNRPKRGPAGRSRRAAAATRGAVHDDRSALGNQTQLSASPSVERVRSLLHYREASLGSDLIGRSVAKISLCASARLLSGGDKPAHLVTGRFQGEYLRYHAAFEGVDRSLRVLSRCETRRRRDGSDDRKSGAIPHHALLVANRLEVKRTRTML